MTRSEVANWEVVRSQGRRRYLVRTVGLWGVPVLIFMAAVGYSHFSLIGVNIASLTAFVLFLCLALGTVVISAFRFWQKNEGEYRDLINRQRGEE